MDAKSLKKLQILEAIAKDEPSSQRQLSDSLHISLGLVNSFIKRLIVKGYCKVTTIPKKRVKYILTSAGALEKTRLTYAYVLSSYHFFKSAKNRLQELFLQLREQGISRLVFLGAGELAEVAYLSLTGTGVRLIDVVDPDREGELFAHMVIQSLSRLEKVDYDRILITVEKDHAVVVEMITSIGVPPEKIIFF